MNVIGKYFFDAMAQLSPLMIDTALKGILLLGLTAVAVSVMRRASASARYLIWLLGVGGLLMLPLLSSSLPKWHALPDWWKSSRLSSVVVPRPVAPISPGRSEAVKEALSEGGGVAVPSPLTQSPNGPIAFPSPGMTRLEGWDSWLAALWAAVTALLGLRLIACWMWLWRVTRSATAVSDPLLIESLGAACARLGLRQPVSLLRSRRRLVPSVWGLWRPSLLLPAESHEWDERRFQAVLLHELAHVKRADLPALFATQIACALHWYNPLVWVAAWRLGIERERACDDLVLNAGVKASDYAGHLLAVATNLHERGPSGALAMARPSRLEARLTAILSEGVNRRGVPRGLVLASFALGLALLVPMSILRAAVAENPGTNGTNPGGKGKEAERRVAKTDDASSRTRLLRVQFAEADLDKDGVISINEFLRYLELREKEPAKESVEVLKVRLSQAEAELARIAELHRSHLVGDAEFDKAKINVELRRAELSGDDEQAEKVRLTEAMLIFDRADLLHKQNLIGDADYNQAKYALEILRAKMRSKDSPAPEKSRETPQEKRGNLLDAESIVRVFNLKFANASAAAKLLQEMAPGIKALADERVNAVIVMAPSQKLLETVEALIQSTDIPKPAAEGGSTSAAPQTGPTRPMASLEAARLLDEEINLAEKELSLVNRMFQNGVGSNNDVMRMRIELLALRRTKAAQSGRPAEISQLFDEQIELLEQLEKETQARLQKGRASNREVLALGREILALKRQKAELVSP